MCAHVQIPHHKKIVVGAGRMSEHITSGHHYVIYANATKMRHCRLLAAQYQCRHRTFCPNAQIECPVMWLFQCQVQETQTFMKHMRALLSGFTVAHMCC